MARLVTCGWETGDRFESGITVGSLGSIVNTNPTPRFNGAYCYKPASSYNGNVNYIRFDLPAPLTEIWIRCPLYIGAWNSYNNVSTFVMLMDSAKGYQCGAVYNYNDNHFYLYRGDRGTQLGMSPLVYPTNYWYPVEVHWTATSAASGVFELWVNNTRVISFSGATITTANVNVQSIAVGGWSPGGINDVSFAFDDLAVNDTTGTVNNGRVGDGRVLYLPANGAGNSTVLTRGGTNTGANWSQVSEVPPSMAQYVQSSNIGDRDLYTLADITGTIISVNSVEELVMAANSDAGPGSLGLTLQSGPTVNEATAQPIASGVYYYGNRWELDPNTGQPWTGAAVNALQAGVTVR
jgi:hypothetical protein